MALVLTAGIGGTAHGSTPPLTAATWCADYRPGALGARQRLEGENLTRLQATQAFLAPGFAAGQSRTGIAMLADYQEEMDRPHPDREAAAAYLATASTVHITLDVVGMVNRTLCVAAGQATAQAIATAAEAARAEMAR
ncbi:MAG: hypothetical protein BGP12_12120 [Rhodospirillales bacterium 70-18]|nr:MAG: hypothetical protein BGP12_12120 [Rhodospirillales bacterium 70-18]